MNQKSQKVINENYKKKLKIKPLIPFSLKKNFKNTIIYI